MANMIRFSPGSEMRNIQREIDRVFDSFFTPRRSGSNGDAASETAVWAPRVDLAETEDAYLIHADLPGIAREDLQINYQDHTLTLSGERRAEAKEEGRNYVRMERTAGTFYRAFSLPRAVQSDAIEADYTDGVLEVRIPKAEESKPRRIEVS